MPTLKKQKSFHANAHIWTNRKTLENQEERNKVSC